MYLCVRGDSCRHYQSTSSVTVHAPGPRCRAPTSNGGLHHPCGLSQTLSHSHASTYWTGPQLPATIVREIVMGKIVMGEIVMGDSDGGDSDGDIIDRKSV